MSAAETIREARARDAARYARDYAEFQRLLATGDIDGARAIVNSDEFYDALGAAVSKEVVESAKEARNDWPDMPATHYHAIGGHANALLAHRWALICAGVAKARIDRLEKRLAELESRGNWPSSRTDSTTRPDA